MQENHSQSRILIQAGCYTLCIVGLMTFEKFKKKLNVLIENLKGHKNSARELELDSFIASIILSYTHEGALDNAIPMSYTHEAIANISWLTDSSKQTLFDMIDSNEILDLGEWDVSNVTAINSIVDASNFNDIDAWKVLSMYSFDDTLD